MKNLYTLLSRKTDPKAWRPNKMKQKVQKQNKKIIIEDNPIQYPDGAVTKGEDCDRG